MGTINRGTIAVFDARNSESFDFVDYFNLIANHQIANVTSL